jgi:hypothetical protein
MAVSNLVAPSTGLSASSLITQPSYTLIGSYTSTTPVNQISISLTNPSLYRSFRVIINQLYPSGIMVINMRLNNLSTSNMYKSNATGFAYVNALYTSRYTESGSVFRIHASSGLMANYTVTGYFDIHNVNTSEKKLIFGTFAGIYAYGGVYIDNFFGEANTSAAITQINFLPSNEYYLFTESTGGISVYGVN